MAPSVNSSKRRLLALSAAVLCGFGLFLALLWFGYVGEMSWIGFSNYWVPKPLVIEGRIVTGYELQRQKTAWDWLQLLVIPTVLAIGGFLFNERLKQREAFAALDTQRENALQKYFDAVSALLLSPAGSGRTADAESTGAPPAEPPDPSDAVIPALTSSLIRARTLTVLNTLDPKRKGDLVRFLVEAKLIQDEIDDKSREPPIKLEYANLRDADLTRLSLRNIPLTHVDLRGADLRWTSLEDAGFDQATTHMDRKWKMVWELTNYRHFARGVDLRNFDLSDANLSGAPLGKADLRGANLTGAILDLAELHETIINARTRLAPKWRFVWHVVSGKTVPQDMERLDLSAVDLHYANLAGKSLIGTELVGSHLWGTTLTGANLDEATASFARFERSHMEQCTLRLAWINGADLTGAWLNGADLAKANASFANFRGADLSDASFTGANCMASNFAGALMNGTSFENASMTGAFLYGADLSAAKGLSQTQLVSAHGDPSTVLPAGMKRPSNWPKEALPHWEVDAAITEARERAPRSPRIWLL